MTASFSLADDPWIPVQMLDGQDRDVGLRELLATAHTIEDLAIPVPPAASGLWRILYALAARITDLDGVQNPDYLDDGGRVLWLDDRREAFARLQFDPDKIADYFARFHERFWLFDPGGRPWLQDGRLAEQCAKTSGLNKIVFARPSGNNHSWWSHTSDASAQPLDPAHAAWWLIAQLYYGASGRCTSRTVGGVASASTKAGPLRGAISFHPLGRNLFESLVAGLPQPQAAGEDVEDWCPWEVDQPDPGSAAQPASWPCGLLTGRARHAALLVASPDRTQVVDAYLTWGTNQPVEAADPYVVRNMSKEGKLYTRPADCDRALWRDLDALLQEGADDKASPPLVFAGFNELPPVIQRSLRVRAYGFDQDGQAADKQYFTAITPPIFKYAPHDQVRWMRECRVAAEQVGRQLAYAAKIARSEATGAIGGKAEQRGNGAWATRALAQYWPQAELGFWDLLDHPGGREPFAIFVGFAIQALENAVGLAASTQPGAKAQNHATVLLLKLLPAKQDLVTKEVR